MMVADLKNSLRTVKQGKEGLRLQRGSSFVLNGKGET
jgi:hypothetical protein